MTKPIKIPDMWLAGYLHAHPDSTVRDAVAYWISQQQLAAEWAIEHGYEQEAAS